MLKSVTANDYNFFIKLNFLFTKILKTYLKKKLFLKFIKNINKLKKRLLKANDKDAPTIPYLGTKIILSRTFSRKLKNTEKRTFFSLPVKFKKISLKEKKEAIKKVKVKILTTVNASKYSAVKKRLTRFSKNRIKIKNKDKEKIININL